MKAPFRSRRDSLLKRGGFAGAICLVTLLAAGPSAAEDSFPKIEVEIPIEIQDDWSYRSDDSANRRNALTTETEAEVTVTFMPGFKLFLHGVLEDVGDLDPGKDGYFANHGLHLENIYLEYDHEHFFVRGGKFTPDFGIAWDEAPGIYGTDFAEDGYEFSERIALAAGVKLGNDSVGEHMLSASTFFRDISPLSGSLITDRDRLKRLDGGVGNTGDFSSFAVSLNGEKVPAVPALKYHIGFIHQRAGTGDSSDENGVAVALTGEFKPWGENGGEKGGEDSDEDKGLGGIAFTPLVEYVRFYDADGIDSQERDFLTLSLLTEWRQWNLALSYTGRNTQAPDGTDTNDALFQVSAGYAFDFGLSVDLGWSITNEDHEETQTVGLLLAYTLKF